MTSTRRSFLGGMVALFATPALVRADSLMNVAGYKLYIPPAWCPHGWLPCEGQLISEAQYPELSAVLGKIWGGHKGKFNLPNMRPGREWKNIDAFDKNGQHILGADRKYVTFINAESMLRSNGTRFGPGTSLSSPVMMEAA